MNRVTDAAMDFMAMPIGIPESWRTLQPAEAAALRDELCRHEGFRSQALERGTAAAEARIWLNQAACGVTPDPAAVARAASPVVNSTSYASWDPSRPGGPAGQNR